MFSNARSITVSDETSAGGNGRAKGQAARQLIRSAGAKLFFLPKYSDDLNPIEQVFAKLKHLLRKAAARSREAVCDTIGKLLDTCTIHPSRVRQLLQKFWIWIYLKSSRYRHVAHTLYNACRRK